ncbi:DUF1499 domain-containing protein [Marinomonas fungiae]|uniref:Uncharacterized conserved protein, DUF1499 family n=1 Tax=Marinomonas fungiae TaxID=1137284 RepID=A0A0K6IIB0_9GAMM|nr:DUF1499 domain-containing protein [Marinomonas fungiae]CUB03062.1 Uncharacterized conserved protein, DUF1499 family [Marinomonas fungiae]
MSMVRWILVVVIAMLIGFFVYVDINNGVPDNLGVNEGLLAPCPDMPNCVSSQASPEDAEHYVEPIFYHTSVIDAQLAIEHYMLSAGGARVVSSALGYTHFEVSSELFGFKDDLEIYFPEADSIMHVRSASRVGYDDLDVNRERVRQIRDLLVD